MYKRQGPVVQKPIDANLALELNLLNLGLNFNPRLLCVVQSYLFIYLNDFAQ
jgi:hypothetical protein